jgi:hypothetical protein
MLQVVMTGDASKVVTSQNLEKRRKDGSWLVRIKVWDIVDYADVCVAYADVWVYA